MKEKLSSTIVVVCEKCSCNFEVKRYYTTKYCNSCREFVVNKKLFEKLNIKFDTYDEANEQAKKILIQEYFKNKKSLVEIREKYNIQLNTLHSFFKKNNIVIRSLSQSRKLVISKKPDIMFSNHNRFSSGTHTTWYGKDIYLRSSYEFRLAKKLDSVFEYYEYEFLRFTYTNKNGEECTYTPDFYLPERNLVIEVKGEWFYEIDRENIELKKQEVIKQGYFFSLMQSKEIDDFNLNAS